MPLILLFCQCWCRDMTHMRRLFVYSTFFYIGSVETAWLKDIKNNPFIFRLLDLSFNRITEIACLDSLTKLNKLYLSSNKITEIKNINHLKKLEMLELGDNRIRVSRNLSRLTVGWAESDIHCSCHVFSFILYMLVSFG